MRERGLQAAVHFVGPLHGADVVQADVDADVFALPSYTENFGMTVAEAQACGCPVATTGRAPMTEVGADAAIYIDPDDPAGAAAAIADGLALRAALVDAGLRNVRRFSGERLVAGCLDAYRDVLGARDVAATAGS